MQTYNPRNPINFHDLIVMADELHKALSNTIDTILEVHDNGEWCPSCGGEYSDTEDNLDQPLWCKHDEECALAKAMTLKHQIIKDGQLTAVKKLHKVSN